MLHVLYTADSYTYVSSGAACYCLLLLLAAGEWAIEAATGGPFPEDKGLVMKVSHGSC